VVRFKPGPLYLRRKPTVTTEMGADWAPELIWSLLKEIKYDSLPPAGNQTLIPLPFRPFLVTVQSVLSLLQKNYVVKQTYYVYIQIRARHPLRIQRPSTSILADKHNIHR